MKMKRFFALMLALALSLTMLQGVAFGAVDNYTFANDVLTIISDADGIVKWSDVTTAVNGIQKRNIKQLVIENTSGVTSIEGSAFIDCQYLTSIDLPDGLLTIGASAFFGCVSLTSIDIPNSVTSIGTEAFNHCSTLASVTLPDGLLTIGASAFRSCTVLTSINIPASVTTIGDSAFNDCDALTSVTFAEGSQLDAIGTDVFQRTALTSINIPASVATIGDSAFNDCDALASVTFAEGSKLETIQNYAFDGCTALTSINIPASVTTIGEFVFQGSGLTTLTFEGNKAGSMSSAALVEATSLKTINLAGNFNQAMVDGLAAALQSAATGRSPLNLSNLTLNYNQSWTDEQVKALEDALKAEITGDLPKIAPYNPNPAPTGGSGSTGSAGAGAWYIGTLNGADGQPTYTQIVDTPDTTAMLDDGNVITVTGQSPTGIIVKLDPTALAGKQSLSINSSIANMQLTAEQIASLIQQAGDNTIHITIKGTPDGSTISILAGGRTITL